MIINYPKKIQQGDDIQMMIYNNPVSGESGCTFSDFPEGWTLWFTMRTPWYEEVFSASTDSGMTHQGEGVYGCLIPSSSTAAFPEIVFGEFAVTTAEGHLLNIRQDIEIMVQRNYLGNKITNNQ